MPQGPYSCMLGCLYTMHTYTSDIHVNPLLNATYGPIAYMLFVTHAIEF